MTPEDIASALASHSQTALINRALRNYSDPLWKEWMYSLLTGNDASVLDKAKVDGGVCVHAFKPGECAYICTDCGTDPTCIQCIPCFKDSVHVDHEYRMVNAGGGGCCDCGDIDSWAQEGFCSKHSGPIVVSPEEITALLGETAVTTSRETLVPLLTILCKTIGQVDGYFITFGETSQRLFEESFGKSDVQAVLLCNDEVHSFQNVADALSEAFESFPRQVKRSVTLRFGIRVDSRKKTVVAVSRMETLQPIIGALEAAGLRLEYIAVDPNDCTIYSENQLRAILQFLTELCAKSEVFRMLVSECIAPLLDVLIPGSFGLPEGLWNDMQSFIFQLLVSNDFKLKFSLAMLKNFDLVITKNEHYSMVFDSVRRHPASMLDFLVQVFTIPTLMQSLVRNTDMDILNDMLTGLRGSLMDYVDRWSTFNGDIDYYVFSRVFHWQSVTLYTVISNVKYVLRNVGVMELLFKERLDLLQTLFHVIGLLEGVDPQKRHIGPRHVDFQNEMWKVAFLVASSFAEITLLLEARFELWIAQVEMDDVADLLRFMERTVQGLCDAESYQSRVYIDDISSLSSCYELPESRHRSDYNVSDRMISFHLPIRRLLVTFYRCVVTRFQLNIFDVFPKFVFKSVPRVLLPKVSAGNEGSYVDIDGSYVMFEPFLHVSAALAHIRSGLWRLNGECMELQSVNYAGHIFYENYYKRDLEGLQLACELWGATEFIERLVFRTGLTAFMKFRGENLSLLADLNSSLSDIDAPRCLSVLEMFLKTLIGLMTLRGDDVKRGLVQWLLIPDESHTFSSLNQCITQETTRENAEDKGFTQKIQETLDEIAVYVSPQGVEEGKYVLKDAFLTEFDPFYVTFSTEEKSKAEESFLQRSRRVLSEENIVFPPVSTLRAFPAELSECLEILTTDAFREIAFNALFMSSFRSSLSVSAVLRLLCIGMTEVASDQFFRVFTQQRRVGKEETCILELFIGVSGEGAVKSSDIVTPAVTSLFKVHIALLRWILKELKEKSKLCRLVLSHSTSAQVDPEAKTQSDKKLRKRKEAKARAMRLMEERRSRFMTLHEEELKEQSPESQETGTYGPNCILCRSPERSSEMGYLMNARSTSLLGLVGIEDSKRCSARTPRGTVVDLCGHLMHFDCFEAFFASLRQRQADAMPYEGHHCIDLNASQFMCPLCKAVCNGVLPLYRMEGRSREAIMHSADVSMGCAEELKSAFMDLMPKATDSDLELIASRRDRIVECLERFTPISIVPGPDHEGATEGVFRMLHSLISMKDISLRSFESQSLQRDLDHMRDIFVCGIGLAAYELRHGQDMTFFIDALWSTPTKGRQSTLMLSSSVCAAYAMFNASREEKEEFSVLFGESLCDSLCTMLFDAMRLWFHVHVAHSVAIGIRDFSGSSSEVSFQSMNIAVDVVATELIVYLRHACLLFHVCGLLQSPKEVFKPLTSAGKECLRLMSLLKLCSYDSFEKCLRDMLRDESVVSELKSRLEGEDKRVGARLSLISLPKEYESLFITSANASCSECGSRPKLTVMCLICGAVLCFRPRCKSTRSTKGLLTIHADKLHDRVGIFLSLMRSTVILTSYGYGVEYISPYLDKHGEQDEGLSRGRPLFLDENRYENIEKMWLEGKIPNVISRKRLYSTSVIRRNAW